MRLTITSIGTKLGDSGAERRGGPVEDRARRLRGGPAAVRRLTGRRWMEC